MTPSEQLRQLVKSVPSVDETCLQSTFLFLNKNQDENDKAMKVRMDRVLFGGSVAEFSKTNKFLQNKIFRRAPETNTFNKIVTVGSLFDNKYFFRLFLDRFYGHDYIRLDKLCTVRLLITTFDTNGATNPAMIHKCIIVPDSSQTFIPGEGFNSQDFLPKLKGSTYFQLAEDGELLINLKDAIGTETSNQSTNLEWTNKLHYFFPDAMDQNLTQKFNITDLFFSQNLELPKDRKAKTTLISFPNKLTAKDLERTSTDTSNPNYEFVSVLVESYYEEWVEFFDLNYIESGRRWDSPELSKGIYKPQDLTELLIKVLSLTGAFLVITHDPIKTTKDRKMHIYGFTLACFIQKVTVGQDELPTKPSLAIILQKSTNHQTFTAYVKNKIVTELMETNLRRILIKQIEPIPTNKRPVGIDDNIGILENTSPKLDGLFYQVQSITNNRNLNKVLVVNTKESFIGENNNQTPEIKLKKAGSTSLLSTTLKLFSGTYIKAALLDHVGTYFEIYLTNEGKTMAIDFNHFLLGYDLNLGPNDPQGSLSVSTSSLPLHHLDLVLFYLKEKPSEIFEPLDFIIQSSKELESSDSKPSPTFKIKGVVFPQDFRFGNFVKSGVAMNVELDEIEPIQSFVSCSPYLTYKEKNEQYPPNDPLQISHFQKRIATLTSNLKLSTTFPFSSTVSPRTTDYTTISNLTPNHILASRFKLYHLPWNGFRNVTNTAKSASNLKKEEVLLQIDLMEQTLFIRNQLASQLPVMFQQTKSTTITRDWLPQCSAIIMSMIADIFSSDPFGVYVENGNEYQQTSKENNIVQFFGNHPLYEESSSKIVKDITNYPSGLLKPGDLRTFITKWSTEKLWYQKESDQTTPVQVLVTPFVYFLRIFTLLEFLIKDSDRLTWLSNGPNDLSDQDVAHLLTSYEISGKIIQYIAFGLVDQETLFSQVGREATVKLPDITEFSKRDVVTEQKEPPTTTAAKKNRTSSSFRFFQDYGLFGRVDDGVVNLLSVQKPIMVMENGKILKNISITDTDNLDKKTLVVSVPATIAEINLNILYFGLWNLPPLISYFRKRVNSKRSESLITSKPFELYTCPRFRIAPYFKEKQVLNQKSTWVINTKCFHGLLDVNGEYVVNGVGEHAGNYLKGDQTKILPLFFFNDGMSMLKLMVYLSNERFVFTPTLNISQQTKSIKLLGRISRSTPITDRTIFQFFNMVFGSLHAINFYKTETITTMKKQSRRKLRIVADVILGLQLFCTFAFSGHLAYTSPKNESEPYLPQLLTWLLTHPNDYRQIQTSMNFLILHSDTPLSGYFESSHPRNELIIQNYNELLKRKETEVILFTTTVDYLLGFSGIKTEDITLKEFDE